MPETDYARPGREQTNTHRQGTETATADADGDRLLRIALTEPELARDCCIACGGAIAPILVGLGSTRCHGCRPARPPAAIPIFEPNERLRVNHDAAWETPTVRNYVGGVRRRKWTRLVPALLIPRVTFLVRAVNSKSAE